MTIFSGIYAPLYDERCVAGLIAPYSLPGSSQGYRRDLSPSGGTVGDENTGSLMLDVELQFIERVVHNNLWPSEDATVLLELVGKRVPGVCNIAGPDAISRW